MYLWPVVAVLGNILFVGCMWSIQSWESRNGRIDQRVRHDPRNPLDSFLYLQDFWTNTWGDILGLSLVDYAVTFLIQDTWPLDSFGIAACIGVGAIATAVFLVACLGKRHKPDAGYSKTGKVSLAARMHLLYFAVQVAVSAIGLWIIGLMLLGWIPWTLGAFLGMGGGAVFILTFVLDVRTGRFASLPKTIGSLISLVPTRIST